MQQIIILLLFLIASSYMGWRFWNVIGKKSDGGCAKGCGCAADKASSLKL